MESTGPKPACVTKKPQPKAPAPTACLDGVAARTSPYTAYQRAATPLGAQRLCPSDVVALQRTIGNRAVARLLVQRHIDASSAASEPSAAAIAPLAQRGTVQRYAELDADALDPPNKAMAPIWMSEGRKFFRREAMERELWAEGPEIESAKTITGHKGGILDVAAGKSRTVNGKEYNQVLVSNRAEPGKDDSPKGVGVPSAGSANEPFAKILDILNAHGNRTLGELIQKTKETFNPYPYGTYANGAFEAIRTQFGLEIAKQIDAAPDGKAHQVDAKKLDTFIKSWQGRIGKVNSEEAHEFKFMVTECGGFSKMVAAGEEGTQATVEAGGRMRMDVDEDIPGPWRNHYAAVIMTDGPDRVTLESAAGMDKWWFGMYGSRNLGQTFIVKTLLAKLDIGAKEGEAGSSAAADYVRAKLAGDDKSALASAGKLKEGLQGRLDGLLAEAGATSIPGPKLAPVVKPGKALADKVAQLRAALVSASTKIMSSRLEPKLTDEQQVLGKKFTDAAQDRMQAEYNLLTGANADELGAVIARIMEERDRLLVPTIEEATTFSQVESRMLMAEHRRWFPNEVAKATFQTRIDETSAFLKAWSDTSWLPDAKPAVVVSEVVSKSSPSVISGGGDAGSGPPSSSSSPLGSADRGLEVTPITSSPSSSMESSSSLPPDGHLPLSEPLGAIGVNPALTEYLTALDVGWSSVVPRAERGDGGMIVGSGMGVMLGEASRAKDVAPVTGPIVLPPALRFLTNNGSGARCFVYSVVMGLTGRPQSGVEHAVGEIALRAGVGSGWIASDSAVAQRVIAEVEQMFGVAIQVVELQNSDQGLRISGRSHEARPEARRPIVIRNTGAHYDAIV